jgi:hypothetical protein
VTRAPTIKTANRKNGILSFLLLSRLLFEGKYIDDVIKTICVCLPFLFLSSNFDIFGGKSIVITSYKHRRHTTQASVVLKWSDIPQIPMCLDSLSSKYDIWSECCLVFFAGEAKFLAAVYFLCAPTLCPQGILVFSTVVRASLLFRPNGPHCQRI